MLNGLNGSPRIAIPSGHARSDSLTATYPAREGQKLPFCQIGKPFALGKALAERAKKAKNSAHASELPSAHDSITRSCEQPGATRDNLSACPKAEKMDIT
jgi:hypothetical protein